MPDGDKGVAARIRIVFQSAGLDGPDYIHTEKDILKLVFQLTGPHGPDLTYIRIKARYSVISTHRLAWSLTQDGYDLLVKLTISIRRLAWSLTSLRDVIAFPKTFQSAGSHGA